MNRLSPTRLLSVVIALVVGGALFPARSSATGGSTWKMTLNNPTRWRCTVDFYYGVTAEQKYISPGGRIVFNVPGALCPVGFMGHIDLPDGRNVRIRSTNCLGNQTSHEPATSCCWNVEFDVCLKAGTPDTPDEYIRDDDYGFCKK